MKYRKIAGIASMIIFAISILSLSFRGLSLGLDFSGGTLVEVTYETPVELESIRNDSERIDIAKIIIDAIPAIFLYFIDSSTDLIHHWNGSS